MLRESDTLGARLAANMTSPDVALKHFVQEFLYMACDEDGLCHSTAQHSTAQSDKST